jgi:hypothetical protein
MREVHTEIEINAPAERVWQILTDFDHWSEWNPFLYRVIGKAEQGEHVKLYFEQPNGKEMKLNSTITKLEPEHEWIWKYPVIWSGLFQGEHSFAVEKIDENHTRFIQNEVFTGLLVPMFLKEKETISGFEAMDKALKAQAE